MEKAKIRCEIYFQGGEMTEAGFSGEGGEFFGEDIFVRLQEEKGEDFSLARIRLEIKNEAFKKKRTLRKEKPVKVCLAMEEIPRRITAMYLYNPWWTRPKFVESTADIPPATQIAFLQYDTYFACLLPMVGEHFKASLRGERENEICLEMDAGLAGISSLDEPLYLFTKADSMEAAIEKAFGLLSDYQGVVGRQKRRVPEIFQYLGWCSWDAFYREVNEEGIRRKAEEFKEKKVPVRWFLIDDGWMDSKGELLCGFLPDKEKFPKGFSQMIEDIKKEGMIDWFGVWHAFGGYWGGIDPESSLCKSKEEALYRTLGGSIFPSPMTGESFYRDWYRLLRKEGIDFVKVDGQSFLPSYFEDSLPLPVAARGLSQALEGAASYMDGALINCMGMAMENMVARPSSAISRNSDDFLPDKEESFREHLLQNAYNALYHDRLYCCDWDMFWTRHKDSVGHSLLRAVSGGPVYISDRVGDTKAKLLEPLTYVDGRILMAEQAARPTEDCIFKDPFKEGVLKLYNLGKWGQEKRGGLIAAYNLSGSFQTYDFCPWHIRGLDPAQEYWVFDYFQKKAVSLKRQESYRGSLEKEEFAYFLILAKKELGACLGLLDKYLGFTAAESILQTENRQTVILKETGTLAFLSEKEPKAVRVNGEDFTKELIKEGELYTIPLKESPKKAVAEIIW